MQLITDKWLIDAGAAVESDLLLQEGSMLKRLVLGPRDAPSFAPVRRPTDGFVANTGVIIDL